MHIILLYSVENVGNKRGIQYGILDQTTSFCKILDFLPYRRGGYWIHKTRVGNCADWTRIVRLPDIRCIFMLLCLLVGNWPEINRVGSSYFISGSTLMYRLYINKVKPVNFVMPNLISIKFEKKKNHRIRTDKKIFEY